MFKNYLKLGIRNLLKHKLSSFINIAGLALAVGCCIMVFEYGYWALNQDGFNHKIDQIFVIERTTNIDGQKQNYGNSPAPLGPMLKNEFAQVKQVARLNYRNVVIKQGENLFKDKVTFVDNSFYDIFDFPVKWGDKQQFSDQDGIVLTEEFSEKLFGHVNVIGKIVNIRFRINGNDVSEPFIIKGVLDKRPTEASFGFSALVPFSKMASLGLDKPGDWSQSTDITFIEAENEVALSAIKATGSKYLDLYNAANADDKISAFHFQPLKTMNFHAYKVKNSHFYSMEPIGLIMLLVIAAAILLLVYFNYINITIASASERLKEISIRKVMGSSRGQIIAQFVTENLILCTLAVFAGLFLSEIFFFPWFSTIAGFELGKDLFLNLRTWIAILLLIVVSAISGALYPSFYISSFNTVSIMKGKTLLGSKNKFRKALLGLQFFLTFLSISTAIAFIQETKHIKDRPWGYDPADQVVVSADRPAAYSLMKESLKAHKNIKSVTGSVQPLGQYTKEILVKNDGKTELVKSINVLPGFASQLGINILSGRDFKDNLSTDQNTTVIVNNAFLKMMNWSSAIGKNITVKEHRYLIVGEVNDFHYENFENKVEPMVMMGCKPEEVKFMYIKTSSSLFSNAHEELKSVWQKIYPDVPFDYHYQEDVFNGYFDGFSQITRVLTVASIIMTIVSISGVFGLALIILSKKMKEISVRKILGAGIRDIIYLVYKEFLFALGIAILLGVPLSLMITSSMFKQLSSDSSFSILPIGISIFALVFTTAISVSWHIFKACTSNISPYLKEE